MTAKDQDQQMPQTLAQMRKTTKLTQAEVAEKMGVSREWVKKVEASYPNVRYQTLVAYITALGGHVVFTGVGVANVGADQLIADPTTARTRDYLKEKASKAGQMRINQEVASAKELPLQGNQPDPGGDDPGRKVDQADTQGDQGDGGQRQEP